jgi:hypothetical protein
MHDKGRAHTTHKRQTLPKGPKSSTGTWTSIGGESGDDAVCSWAELGWDGSWQAGWAEDLGPYKGRDGGRSAGRVRRKRDKGKDAHAIGGKKRKCRDESITAVAWLSTLGGASEASIPSSWSLVRGTIGSRITAAVSYGLNGARAAGSYNQQGALPC